MFTRFTAKALLASLTAGFVTFAVAPAHAQSDAPRSVSVFFGDLNLKSDAGKAHLARRINVAAREVCGSADVRDFNGMEAMKNCRNEAIATANRGLVEVFAKAETALLVAAR